MDMYNKKDRSIPQKVVILLLEVLLIAASYWILFDKGYEKIFKSKSMIEVNDLRHSIIFAFNIILFLRLLLTTFYLIKRRIPWEEAFSIPFAFALYYLGFALLGYTSNMHIDFFDGIGIVLFFTGSYINTASELMRDRWKKKKENKGKLYTSGLFRYSMHINYFGDILWVSAYAIISRNWYSISIPIFLLCFFIFYNIPKLDEYLASRYGKEFEDYRKRTKKLIPFIY